MLEMRGHCHELAHGNDARAADAGHKEVIAIVANRGVRFRDTPKRLVQPGGVGRSFPSPAFAAFDRHEARAEAVDAGIVFIAVILVDLAFAAELRFLRHYGEAVRFDRAVTATLTHEFVDLDEPVRVVHQAAFASASFLGGAGLRVNEYRYSGNVSQFVLNRVEISPMGDRRARRKVFCIELLRLVRQQRNALYALGADRMRDCRYGYRSVHGLATRHRDGIVEKDLEGDVGTGSNGLAYRH